MFKKLLKLLKFIITGTIWTYLYTNFASFITIYFWKFNIFSTQNWTIIARYWNSGRAITDAGDFIFFCTLLILFIFWFIGLFWLYKRNFLNILLFPINLYNNYICRKYGNDSTRIILKNMGTGQKQDIKKIIEQKLSEDKPVKHEKIDIRSSIKKKIESSKK